MELTIRAARLSDLTALRQLWKELDTQHAQQHPDYFRVADRDAAWGRELIGAATQQLWVAECDQLCGALLVRVYDTPQNPLLVSSRRGYVEELVVHHAYRRQGIGRKLMQAAATWCRRRGATQLLLTVWSGNEEAEALYRRLGYGELNRVYALELEGEGGE